MTHRTTAPVALTTAHGRKLVAEFSAGHLTSDAGLVLLREADRQIGLVAALDAAIDDPRAPERIEHPQATLLAQRLFGLAAGYEDLNDHHHLRRDPLWQAATDHPEVEGSAELASPPTLCRLENRITRRDLVRLAAVLVDQFVASFDAPPAELILDIDATDDPIHGRQEKHFFHGYYDAYCFLPLYVTCGSRLLVADLRPANIGADHHARAIIKLLVTRLRQAWPAVNILTELEKAEVGTIRRRLFRVAALVVTSVRRLVVRLARSYVCQALFVRVARQLRSPRRADST